MPITKIIDIPDTDYEVVLTDDNDHPSNSMSVEFAKWIYMIMSSSGCDEDHELIFDFAPDGSAHVHHVTDNREDNHGVFLAAEQILTDAGAERIRTWAIMWHGITLL